MTAADALAAGDLPAATAAATEAVKQKPADRGARWLLVDLLFVAEDFDRADKHLAALDTVESMDGVNVLRWRRVVRAAVARREVFTQGRIPTMLAEPAEHVKFALSALLALREGDTATAADRLRAAAAARPDTLASVDGAAAGLIQDSDDVTAGVVEAFGGDGEYYWVPFELITAIEFRPPTRARELVARPARWSLRSGQVGEVVIPAVYFDSAKAGPLYALGRMTDTPAGDVVRGVGQREWLVGDAVHPLLSVTKVHFPGAPT